MQTKSAIIAKDLMFSLVHEKVLGILTRLAVFVNDLQRFSRNAVFPLVERDPNVSQYVANGRKDRSVLYVVKKPLKL